MCPVLLSVLVLAVPRTLELLRRDFRSLDRGRLEDAIGDAWVVALERPQLFERARERDGERGVRRLFRCVAWRNARAVVRRKAFHLERGGDALALAPVGRLPGQEHAANFCERLEAGLEEAARQYAAGDPARLRAALEHRFLEGESDRGDAARFGVTRESLNRAKRMVQKGILCA